MGNCSPKTFHYESPPRPDAWYIDGPSILPEPLETEYMKRPEYEPIWLRPLPDYLEPLKPLSQDLSSDLSGQDFSCQDSGKDSGTQVKFTGKLAPLKLC